jgi:hypothetical protein
MKKIPSVLGAMLVLILASGDRSVDAQENARDAQGKGRRFRITVTNLSAAQVFTPILAASHRRGLRIFGLGDAASVEVEAVAEAGDTQPSARVKASTQAARETRATSIFTVGSTALRI